MQRGARLGADEAVADEHRAEARGAGETGDVDRVLDEHRRLVVGERHGSAARAFRHRDDPIRLDDGLRPLERAAVTRKVMVLAERAAEVAPEGADGERERPRQKRGERLLLDGIDLERRGVAVGVHHERAAFVAAHMAGADAARRDAAPARAESARRHAVHETHEKHRRTLRRRWIGMGFGHGTSCDALHYTAAAPRFQASRFWGLTILGPVP